jgi:hypothetical protein
MVAARRGSGRGETTAWPRRGHVRAETTAWPRRCETAAVRAVAKNSTAATDDSVGGDGSARADTVGDGDVTAVAECRLAKAGYSWRSRGDGVAEKTRVEPRRRRGGDETTAWPRQRRGRCNGVAETTRRRGAAGYGGDGDVLLFRAAEPSATLNSHLATLLLQV